MTPQQRRAARHGLLSQFAPGAGTGKLNTDPIGVAYDVAYALNPGADVIEATNYSGETMDALKRGDYLNALANFGLTGGSIAMMAFPGTLKDVKGVTDGLLEAISKGAKKGKKGKGSKKKGRMTQTKDLREMTTEEAIQEAAKEPHLIKGSDGQYVGAPRGFKTKQRVNKQRSLFDDEVAAGAEGGDWYERARQFNIDSQPDDKYLQSLAADEQALWSAQANPDTNLGWAIDARNSYNAGLMPDKIRTGQQARSYNEARDQYRPMMGHNGGPPLDGVGRVRLGKKTGIYGQHLDPNQPPATTGTNDIWHARQLGYTNADGGEFSRALTAQEHRYMDYETMLAVKRANEQKLGGRDDWTGAEIQAAPWVAGKGRALAARSGGKKSVEEGIAEAAKTYPDYARKYTINAPYEQIPGASTGLLDALQDAPMATKRAFTGEASWRDARGRDLMWDETMGGTYNLPTKDGTGAYVNSNDKLEINPVEVGQPMSVFRTDDAGRKYIPEHDVAALDANAAVRGLLDMQEGVAWNKVIPHGSGPKIAFEANIGRMPTEKEMAAVAKLADKYGVGVVANTGDGLAFRHFGHEKTADVTKFLKSDFGKELQKILPDNMKIEKGTWAGDKSPIGAFFDISKELASGNMGKGEATTKMLAQIDELESISPQLADNLLNSTAPQIKAKQNLARLDKWQAQLGGEQRDDYRRLLQIVGKERLAGLRSYVKKYGPAGLPAIAMLGIFGDEMGGPGQSDQD